MSYNKKMYLNCLYSVFGCHGPCECQRCGFDKDEAARRKAIPLTKGADGTKRKVVRVVDVREVEERQEEIWTR